MVYLSANIIRPEMLFWGGNSGAIIFKVSILATLIGFVIRGKDVFLPFKNREFFLVLWVWVAVAASLYFSDYPLHAKSWLYAEEFLKMSVIAWLIIGLIIQRNAVTTAVNTLLTVTSLLSLWGWDQSFRGNSRLEGLGGQAFGDSNHVAAFGVLFFPLALHLFMKETRPRVKVLYLFSFVLIGGMIVFTQSRGGFIGLACAVIYLMWRSPRRKALATCLFLFILVLSPFIGDKYIDRMKTIGIESTELDYSAGSRLVLWNAGWLVFKDNPIFGVGLLNFPTAKAPYKNDLRDRFDEGLLDYSFQGYKVGHSTWFCQMLAECGLFLAIPYLWLILGFFIKVGKIRKQQDRIDDNLDLYYMLVGLESGILGYCVCLAFIDGLISPFLIVHILLATQLCKLFTNSGLTQKRTNGEVIVS
jgi:O-antigen ligase